MATTAGAVFDRLAAEYDVQWSDSAIGVHQRRAVWRWIDPLFENGDRVLDLGCGTGTDAMHLMERGMAVRGIDASGEMARIARGRGVDARQLLIEDIEQLQGSFDGAISNFGALNCVADLRPVARALGRLVRLRGYLAICVSGPCCAWEIAHYLRRVQPGKAFRRWTPAGSQARIGVRVFYPSVRRLVRVFRPDFRLTRWCGVGLLVPPSYVEGFSDRAIERLASADRRLAHLPTLRVLCDHRLVVFQRL